MCHGVHYSYQFGCFIVFFTVFGKYVSNDYLFDLNILYGGVNTSYIYPYVMFIFIFFYFVFLFAFMSFDLGVFFIISALSLLIVWKYDFF